MTTQKSLYLSKVQLKAELERCLNCKNEPCMHACPVNCNPQEFINHAKQNDFAQSVDSITRTNPFAQTCGLICPDKFCQAACTRSKIDFAVNIPRVQATILHHHRSQNQTFKAASQNKKVAIIGAGPAGLSAAASLSANGYRAEIFEETDKIGGALNMIPDSRLPYEVIEKDWSFVAASPLISLKFNSKVAHPQELLQKGFNGVIIASGEPHCTALGVDGEELCLSYMQYLRQPEAYKTSGKVAIIGGGNVAADCAFIAHQNGSEHVEMFVRRRLSDMRISKHEYLELLEHQINITALSSPEKVISENGLLSLYIHKNHMINNKITAEPDTTVKLSGFSIIIKAIGSFADSKIEDERLIYAGDCKTGGSTIVEAISSGQSAAQLMMQKLA